MGALSSLKQPGGSWSVPEDWKWQSLTCQLAEGGDESAGDGFELIVGQGDAVDALGDAPHGFVDPHGEGHQFAVGQICAQRDQGRGLKTSVIPPTVSLIPWGWLFQRWWGWSRDFPGLDFSRSWAAGGGEGKTFGCASHLVAFWFCPVGFCFPSLPGDTRDGNSVSQPQDELCFLPPSQRQAPSSHVSLGRMWRSLSRVLVYIPGPGIQWE